MMIKYINGVIDISGVLFLEQKDRAQKQIQYFSREILLDEKQICNFSGNIRHNKNVAKELDVPYAHLIFPSKPIIFEEEFSREGISIESIVTERHLTDSVIYLKDILSKKDFFIQDSHLNDLGVFKVIRFVCGRLAIAFPDIVPALSNRNFVGDLGMMAGYASVKEAFITGIMKENDSFFVTSLNHALPGNTGMIRLSFNHFAPIKKRAVFFGDSFFANSFHVLAMLFEEVIFVRSPYLIEELARSLQPDLILSGNVERYLVDVPSYKSGRPFFYSYFNPGYQPRLISNEFRTAFSAFCSEKESAEYIAWKSRVYSDYFLKPKLDNSPLDVDKADVLSERDIDLCRDAAIRFEHHNLKVSHHLMAIAHDCRPKGPLIKERLEHYCRELNLDN